MPPQKQWTLKLQGLNLYRTKAVDTVMKNLAEEPSLPALDVNIGESTAVLGEIEITDIPKQMGRKVKLTPELQKRICEVLAAGVTDSAAAAYAGISRDTYYQWLKRKGKIYTGFREAVNEAKAKARIAIEVSIAKGAVNGSPVEKIFYLCNRYPDDWKNVNQMQHSGAVDMTIKVALPDDLK